LRFSAKGADGKEDEDGLFHGESFRHKAAKARRH
jgi:hypothetical protein